MTFSSRFIRIVPAVLLVAAVAAQAQVDPGPELQLEAGDRRANGHAHQPGLHTVGGQGVFEGVAEAFDVTAVDLGGLRSFEQGDRRQPPGAGLGGRAQGDGELLRVGRRLRGCIWMGTAGRGGAARLPRCPLAGGPHRARPAHPALRARRHHGPHCRRDQGLSCPGPERTVGAPMPLGARPR